MGDDKTSKRRVLRFVVTGALLVGPAAQGCGGVEPDYVNTPAPEPAPERTNAPAPETGDGPVVPEEAPPADPGRPTNAPMPQPSEQPPTDQTPEQTAPATGRSPSPRTHNAPASPSSPVLDPEDPLGQP